MSKITFIKYLPHVNPVMKIIFDMKIEICNLKYQMCQVVVSTFDLLSRYLIGGKYLIKINYSRHQNQDQHISNIKCAKISINFEQF